MHAPPGPTPLPQVEQRQSLLYQARRRPVQASVGLVHGRDAPRAAGGLSGRRDCALAANALREPDEVGVLRGQPAEEAAPLLHAHHRREHLDLGALEVAWAATRRREIGPRSRRDRHRGQPPEPPPKLRCAARAARALLSIYSALAPRVWSPEGSPEPAGLGSWACGGGGRPHGRLRAMGTLSLPRRSRPQAGSPGASRGPGRRLGATARARPVRGQVEVCRPAGARGDARVCAGCTGVRGPRVTPSCRSSGSAAPCSTS